MTFSRRALLATVLAVTAFLTACGNSTKIVSEWTEPKYEPKPFRMVVVFGISNQPSLRRTFEDQFADQLIAAGVDAKQSYLYLPTYGKADEMAIRSVVEKAGADGAIVTRLVMAEQKTQVESGFYQPSYVGTGFYGCYSSAWVGGFYDPPTVHTYDVYSTETTLFDIRIDKMVWSAMSRTIDPRNAKDAFASYVKQMIEAMQEKKLLG